MSGGSGEEKRPIRIATGIRPDIIADRDGTHCGAAVNMRSHRSPSLANWSSTGVRTGYP